MGLLTVAELREHVETSLPDTALERILASCELAIAQWFDDELGPVVRGVELSEPPSISA